MDKTHIPAYVLEPVRRAAAAPEFVARPPMPGYIKDIEAGRVELPMIPRIVQRLITALNEPEIELRQIAKTVARDPLLSATVLRLANSSLFGSQRSTASIETAVGMIGFEALLKLLTGHAANAMRSDGIAGIDLRAFWHDALVTAVAANKIAPLVGADPAEAYLCGLLHTTGHLILCCAYPDIADAMFSGFALMRGAELALVEKDAFGTDYATAGAAWVDSLDFPRTVVEAIRTQLTATDDALEPMALALRSGRQLAAAVARKDHNEAALRTLAPRLRSRMTADDGSAEAGFAKFYNALREIKAKG